MSLTTICTTVGLDAAQSARDSGVKLTLSTFALGPGYDYIPTIAATGFQNGANPVYPKTAISGAYTVASDNSLVLVCTVDPTVPTFNFGEIGVYTDGGVLFALGVFSTLQTKSAPDTNTNSTFTFNLHIALAQSATTLQIPNPTTRIAWSNIDGVPTTRDEYPLQSVSATTGNYGVATSETGGLYSFTPSLTPTALAEYQTFDVKFSVACLTNATIQIALATGTATVNLMKRGLGGVYTQVLAGDIQAGDRYQLIIANATTALLTDLKVAQSLTADAASSSTFQTKSLPNTTSAFGAVSPTGEVQLRSDVGGSKGLYDVSSNSWLGYRNGSVNTWNGNATTATGADQTTFQTKQATGSGAASVLRAYGDVMRIELFAHPSGSSQYSNHVGLSVNGNPIIRKTGEGGTAQFIGNSDTASRASTAGLADSATTAGRATTADSATNAGFLTKQASASETAYVRAHSATSGIEIRASGSGVGGAPSHSGLYDTTSGSALIQKPPGSRATFFGDVSGNATTATTATTATVAPNALGGTNYHRIDRTPVAGNISAVTNGQIYTNNSSNGSPMFISMTCQDTGGTATAYLTVEGIRYGGTYDIGSGSAILFVSMIVLPRETYSFNWDSLAPTQVTVIAQA